MRRTSSRSLIVIIALCACAGHASAQERQTRTGATPQTDRTVQVARGSRLSVTNDAGEVVIKTWDRDSIRIQASHAAPTTVDVQTTANLVSVRSRSSGPRRSVDYEITAPSWLPVRVSGQFPYIGIEGAASEVSAETVRGDIVIRGGSGSVTAKTVQGEIIVENAKGRINVNSVNEGIQISGASGEITAETTNGDITLAGIDATLVDLATVNGDIRFEGTIPASAHFRMATHNGDITLVIPESTSATFGVRTYNGGFQTNLAAKVVGDVRRGRRATYSLGTGGAEVELETFSGTIRLRRPGTAPAARERKEKQGKHEDAAGFGNQLFESEQGHHPADPHRRAKQAQAGASR